MDRLIWQSVFKEKFFETFKADDINTFTDVLGFSVVKNYPNRFLGLGKQSKKHNLKALIKFYVKSNSKITSVDKRIPLIVSADITKEETESGRKRYILSDVKIKPKILAPINVYSKDDFFIDATNGKFYKFRNKHVDEVTIEMIYQAVFKLHIADWRTAKGISTRTKIFLLRKIPSLCAAFVSIFLSFLYWVTKGIYFTYDPIIAAFDDETKIELR
jgi:hypothetical protein